MKTNIECIPAAPHISPSPTVYKVEDLGINITEGEEVWVGYFQVVRVFEYIGKKRYMCNLLVITFFVYFPATPVRKAMHRVYVY